MQSNKDYLKLCDLASQAAADAIEDMVGSSDAYTTVYMGADGTPTKKIDAAAEDAIFTILKDDGRSMRLLSEEAGDIMIGEGDKPDFSIILDPLDGTYNAAFGIPFYCVSIAIAKPDLSGTTFGYVQNLANGDTYHAGVSKGSYLNGKSISPSGNSDIHEFCISVYGYRPHVERTSMLCKGVRRIRVLGSVALELCYVASGRMDAFVDVRRALRLTDVAAGIFILEKAGGMVSNELGDPLKLPNGLMNRVDMVASNGHAHIDILKLNSRG
ncbi:MAG: bifunctional fructose-bisphosphatase/inositol-phosphate phosphatase [Methanosarcinaceae archaeon]|nr:bifunctional fructose-bisphosphatase/inositol-phosphate phosphatase [Methanosarcinaceae archaeon]MDF1533851.1 bifunctional fructose-bisphosphatase/inositol-phosphate phosphatase [Methanosarcinaceae archaeon]